MGASGAIQAGEAFVRAFLDDNPVTQGLVKLRAKLVSWQSSLSTFGAKAYGGELPGPIGAVMRFASSPAGLFTGLAAAAGVSAKAGESFHEMSLRTGVAVDKLSALAYASKMAGISNEALGVSLQNLESRFFKATSGIGKGAAAIQAAFERLHIDPAMGGDAADKLYAITAAFTQLDAESQIGLAHRLGLEEMLPLLRQGTENLEAFTRRAKELGLVVSAEDVMASHGFTLALRDLETVAMSCVKSLGGALVPIIEGTANSIVGITKGVRDWIRDHKALVPQVAFAAGAVVAFGVALKLTAVGIGIVSGAIGVLTASVAAVSSVVGLLLSPLGLAAAAAVAAVAAFLDWRSACEWLGKVFGTLLSDFQSAVGSMATALRAGDIRAAAEVMWAMLKLEWLRGKNAILSVWEDLKTGTLSIFDGMFAALNMTTTGAMTRIGREITKSFAFWRLGFAETERLFRGGGNAERERNWMAYYKSAYGLVEPSDKVKDWRRQRGMYNMGEEPGGQNAPPTETPETRARRERDERARKSRREELDAAQREFDEAKRRADALKSPERPEVKTGTERLAGSGSGASVLGTFSGAVANMLGGGDAMGAVADNTKQAADRLASIDARLQSQQVAALSGAGGIGYA